MAGTVGQNQVGTFTTPVNGTTSDASVVLGNDNTTRSAFNIHDADPTIHVQSSTLAGRPAAGTAQRVWMTTDGKRVYIDNSASWDEAAYLPLVGGTLSGNLLFTDALYDIGASGANRPRDVILSRNLDVGGNALVRGQLNVTSTSTFTGAAAFTSGLTTAASSTLSGDLLFTDATYDIGKTGATRPRDIILSRNLSVGGNAAITGQLGVTSTSTFTGALTANGGVVGALTGNASTATALATGRTLAITGDLAWTSPSFDGSGNVTASGTLTTVNSNVGSFGSTTAIPVLTVNAKGLVTAASTAAVVAPAGTLSGATLAANVLASSLTSTGTLAGLTVTATITGSVSGSSGSTTGNAATATALATARAINGTNFDGTAAITITAAAGTLTGATLNPTVTASSLTSVGVLASPHMTGATVDSGGLVITAGDLTLPSTNGFIAGGVRIVALRSNGVGIGPSGATANVGLTISGDSATTDSIQLVDTNAAPKAEWRIGIGTGGGDGIGWYNDTAAAQRMSLSAAGVLSVPAGVTANLTGNCSGTAATVTGAAQTAITSLGTLTSLTSGITTVQALKGSGSTPAAACGTGSVAIVGTDLAGKITYTSDGSGNADTVTVTFATAKASAPYILWSRGAGSSTSTGAGSSGWVADSTTTTFALGSPNTLQTSKTYIFYYATVNA